MSKLGIQSTLGKQVAEGNYLRVVKFSVRLEDNSEGKQLEEDVLVKDLHWLNDQLFTLLTLTATLLIPVLMGGNKAVRLIRYRKCALVTCVYRDTLLYTIQLHILQLYVVHHVSEALHLQNCELQIALSCLVLFILAAN